MIDRVGIIGTGSYLPGAPVSCDRIEDILGHIEGLNESLNALEERVRKNILIRSGVRQRYFAIDPISRVQTESNASMIEFAIRSALKAAQIKENSIDLLVVSAPTSDGACPPLSAMVQHRLGIARCAEIEIHSNCTGAPKAIQVAFDMLRTGRYRRAAVSYAQLSSAFLRAEYFNPTCVSAENLMLRYVLSDGCGALILDAHPSEVNLVGTYIESTGGRDAPGMSGFSYAAFFQDTSPSGRKMIPMIYESGIHHVSQDIHMVNTRAPQHLLEGLAKLLRNEAISAEMVSHFLIAIPGNHFLTANAYELFRRLIGFDGRGRITLSIEDIGYCGGATSLILLDRLIRSGRFHGGEVAAAYVEESSKWMSGGFIVQKR